MKEYVGNLLDNTAAFLNGRYMFVLMFKGFLFTEVVGVFLTRAEAEEAAQVQYDKFHSDTPAKVVFDMGGRRFWSKIAVYPLSDKSSDMYFEIYQLKVGSSVHISPPSYEEFKEL